ncbi:UBN2 domain-containing protein [Tanacetum coccineum]
MNEPCSTIVKDALPLKEKDPGSFTLPCTINNICFDKALADLEASVSVMSYSTFTNLGLGKLALTKLIIELADKTVKHPKGIAENMLDLEFGDFIELNDLNEPLELRNHKIEDLGPTIEEGEVIDEPKAFIVGTRNDDFIVEKN